MAGKTAAPSPIRRRLRTGVWLVGARGSVATTAITGALALRAGLVEPVGTVTARPEFASAGLPGFEELV
ncbi:MAG: inositol-3-phosphate synthase, partial [Pseudonocardiaceae bacterium]